MGLALAGGCSAASAFECTTVEHCVGQDGEAGVCQPAGYCSFSDLACPSGQRYGEYAADRLAESCVPPEDDSGSDGDDSGLTGGTTGIEPNGSGSGSGSTAADESGSGSGTDDSSLLDPDLGLWVTFEDNEGDRSGSDHTLSCVGDCPVATDGPVGRGGQFGGAGHLTLDYASDEALSSEFTVTMWARIDEDGGAGSLFSKQAGDSYTLELAGGEYSGTSIPELFVTVGTRTIVIGDIFETGDWLHIAATHAPGRLELSLNGIYIDGWDVPSVPADDSPIFVGGKSEESRSTATIDDVRVYHRRLSAADIAGVALGEDPV